MTQKLKKKYLTTQMPSGGKTMPSNTEIDKHSSTKIMVNIIEFSLGISKQGLYLSGKYCDTSKQPALYDLKTTGEDFEILKLNNGLQLGYLN